MEIHTHSFCGLSRNQDWQTWLNSVANDLNQELIETIKSRKGCRANSQKMQEIYIKLYERNLGSQFEKFISQRFPWLIKSNNSNAPEPPKPKTPKQYAPQTKIDYSDLNKHKVFKSYKPNILTFPQKMILTGHPDSIWKRVQAFCKDKLAVDYIIIEDRAYIEYFHPKYAQVIDKYPREKREIYQYRMQLEQNG